MPSKDSSTNAKTRSRKSKKKGDGVKHPITNFMIFSGDARKTLSHEKFPTGKQQLKELGVLWKNISVEDKKVYNERAVKDKERYKREKKEQEELRALNPNDHEGDNESEDESDSGEQSKRGGKRKKSRKMKEPAVPSVITAFIGYCNLNREKVKLKLGSGKKIGDISKELGSKWRGLTKDEQKPYKENAELSKKNTHKATLALLKEIGHIIAKQA